MESISAWILSIAGICMLSVIIDLVVPDGKTNTIIKNVFSDFIDGGFFKVIKTF